ncbi:MAG: hypothetical protein NC203_00325 [Firmicutes bacterium]|nr:hypothetical protein [Bacillota bacterium]
MAKEEIKETSLTEDEEKRVDEVAEEMEATEGQLEYKLIKPILLEGTQYDTLHFDFESLTTEDALNIDDELEAKGHASYMAEAFNSRFLMLMAVKACKEPLTEAAFKKICITDYYKIKNRARNFLVRLV